MAKHNPKQDIPKREPFDLMTLAPTDDKMLAAWLGCLHWAMGDPEVIQNFRQSTGINWTPAVTPIERMIDESCGASDHFMEHFVRWVNREIWGEVNGRACNGDELSIPENA